MLRSSGIKTITRNIRTKDEKYRHPIPALQRRPGDWYGGPTGDRNWIHLVNTKKDIHSLIKFERLGRVEYFKGKGSAYFLDQRLASHFGSTDL